MSKLFEGHVTIEPVFDADREKADQLAKLYGFKLADLLMQKKRSALPERSDIIPRSASSVKITTKHEASIPPTSFDAIVVVSNADYQRSRESGEFSINSRVVTPGDLIGGSRTDSIILKMPIPIEPKTTQERMVFEWFQHLLCKLRPGGTVYHRYVHKDHTIRKDVY